MANQEKTAAELYREERKKRIAKAAKRNSKKHVSEKAQKNIVSVIAILLVIAIVGTIAGGIVKNKGIFERNKVIMTIGDTEIDKYEYAYYYSSTLQQVASQSAEFDMNYGAGMGALYTGYDYTKMPSEQKFSGEIEGVEEPTYADYFNKQTVENLKYVKACLAYAEKNDIKLEEEDYAQVDKTFETIEANCKNQDGTSYSVGAYLRLSYGDGMTEELFRRILEEQTLAQKVMTTKQAEYAASYSDKEIEKTYNDKLDTYGLVSLRSYAFAVEKDEDADKATSAQIADAKTKAEAFAAEVTDEESFKKLASEAAKEAGEDTPEKYLSDDTLTLAADASLSGFSSDKELYNWVKAAKAGDTYVAANDSAATVYYMVEPVHKAADDTTYDVRHILIQFPEDDKTETDTKDTTDASAEGEEETTTEASKEDKKEVEPKEFDASKYDAVVDNKVKTPITDAESYNKAVDVLTTYLEGEKTEESFAALATLNSSDGNAAQGGIYEGVTVGQMVSEFEGWALDKSRKAGDVGIVETRFGYHIMYFIKVDTTTWSDTIRNDLATEKYSKLSDKLIAGDNVKADNIDADMVADLDVRMEDIAKNVYNTYKNYMANYGSGY